MYLSMSDHVSGVKVRPTMECPSADALLDFAAQKLLPARARAMRSHLQVCASCRLVLASARECDLPDEMAETVLGPVVGAEGAVPVLSNIGRFEIIDILGSGASGIVYSARDPELERLVAIKLLAGSDAKTSEQRAMLTQEAQAMAKVRHENVVIIYEVGVLDEQVYLVMELVDGMPLGKWLEGSHTPLETISKFMQAGAGLAAAHAVGIVHRDFKPANVFVGHDGGVRVGDFGLARMEVGGDEASRSEVVGTPAYMPPEQFEGKPGTAKSDQYSFCASLYEALVGHRPHQHGSLPALREAVLSGAAIAREADVLDGHCFSVLRQGLSTRPQDRFSSMLALLAELARDPAAERRKRRIFGATGVVGAGAIGALAIVALQKPNPAPLCRSIDRHLSGVWDNGIKKRASELYASFGVGGTGAQSSFALVRQRLDSYSERWVAMRQTVCEATQIRGEQSEAVMQLQMDCLDRRLSELRELTLVVLQADDATILDRVVGAANELTSITVCDEVDRLSEQFPVPEGAEQRRHVLAVSDRLDRANVLYKTGQYRRAQAILARLVSESKATGYLPIEAETLYLLGVIQHNLDLPIEAEGNLREAIQIGARAKHDLLVQKSWMELLQVVGLGLGHADDALALRTTVEAAMARTGDRPTDQVLFLNVLGRIASRSGDIQKARTLHEEALKVAVREFGEGSLAAGQTREVLGEAFFRLGDYVRAKEHLELALAALTKNLGAKHPDVGNVLKDLASNAAAHGDNQAAEVLYTQALALMERAVGPSHRTVAVVLAGLADVQGRMEKYDLATGNLLAALEVYKNSPEENDPDIAPVLNGLAILLLHQHKRREALPYLLEALSALESEWPEGHPSIAQVETNIGLLHGGLGDDQQAQRHCSRALALTRPAVSKESQSLLGILNCLATSALKLEEYANARELFEEARVVGASHPVLLAELEFGLAQTFIHTDGNRREAKRLATKSRAVFASGGHRMEDSVKEVDAWLRTLD